MRTTVAIPLHGSAPWVDVVARNVESLRGVARVVISDPQESDDALKSLQSRFADRDDVTFVGARRITEGWVAHCNDLQRRNRTEFFMWLPHDDEIDAEWIRSAEIALDSHPPAALACGVVVPHDGDDARSAFSVEPRLAEPVGTQRRQALARIVGSGDSPALGILFRGVQRASMGQPLPGKRDEPFVDVVWATGLVASHFVVGTSAVYRKRWHAASAHANWPSFGAAAGAQERAVAALIRECSASEAAALLETVWLADRMRLDREHSERELALTTALGEAVSEMEAMRASVSWRVTSPLRKVRSATRREK